jgi:soluble lytic murein transglycosylase
VSSRRFAIIPFLVISLLLGLGASLGAAQTTRKKSTTHKSSSKSRKRAAKHRASPQRVRRVRKAFQASTTLRPMAQQLLQDRSAAAYAGVEAYARKHAGEDAGALAWLVLGYARLQDHDLGRAAEAFKRAQPHAGDIGDYADYFLAVTLQQNGANTQAETLLANFDTKYPDSIFLRDAHVIRATALLALNRRQEAIDLLEKDRLPTRADLELVLGRAYAANGDKAKATAILANIYYTMPLSPEADDALRDLQKLGPVPGSFSDRKGRADLLSRGKRYSEAADAYRSLLNEAGAADRPAIEAALGNALFRSGRRQEARRFVESVTDTTGEANAQRLYMLLELQRSSDDQKAMLATLEQMRQSAPGSPWLEQALLATANKFLLDKQYDRALDFYRELQQRFPTGGLAHYAHWKAAWLAWRLGRTAEAKQGFEQQIALYPDSPEVSAALYWRGRLAEEEHEPGRARAYYLKLAQTFRNYYYAELARQRLRPLLAVTPVEDAVLQKVRSAPYRPKRELDTPPADNLQIQKARLLANGALLEFALRELQQAAKEEGGNWEAAEMARVCQEAGRYDRAIEVLKRTVPTYFAMDLNELPDAYWKALFPRPFWSDLRKFAEANGLDPYVVASLIRQESAFNPNAVSRANAVGLMQLLPKTGRLVARDVKLRNFNASQLFTPTVNIQLGTRYFRTMVDKFGALEYALAAYNAGDDRVVDWRQQGNYRDVFEFVESIPFTETREYVQAIMRNASVYRMLYGTAEQEAAKSSKDHSSARTVSLSEAARPAQ